MLLLLLLEIEFEDDGRSFWFWDDGCGVFLVVSVMVLE